MSLRQERKDKAVQCSLEMIENIRSGSFIVERADNELIRKMIRELAGRLFCSGGHEHNGKNGYCGKCNDCRMLFNGNHPDLHIIQAKDSAAIKIDDMRLLKEQVHTKPFQAQVKIFVIENAERMSIAAANALLKTLEEPPAGVIIILMTTSISRLLPTVVSRCKRIRFFSEGKKSSSNEEYIEQFLSKIFSSAKEQRHLCIGDDISSMERGQISAVLQELVSVFRDMLMVKIGVEDVALMSGQGRTAIDRWGGDFPTDSIEKLIDETLQAENHINRNANIKLSMDLLIKIINNSKIAL